MKENLNQLAEIYSKKPVKAGGQYNRQKDDDSMEDLITLPELGINNNPNNYARGKYYQGKQIMVKNKRGDRNSNISNNRNENALYVQAGSYDKKQQESMEHEGSGKSPKKLGYSPSKFWYVLSF